VDADGKELPKNDSGEYVGSGSQKVNVQKTDATADPLMDDAGNPVEGGTPEALLHAVLSHFKDEDDTEIVSVTILEIRPVREVSGLELARL
jgi:hypothetical protein